MVDEGNSLVLGLQVWVSATAGGMPDLLASCEAIMEGGAVLLPPRAGIQGACHM